MPCSHCHVTYCTNISCISSLPFTTPVLWHHGIVKCPPTAHFRISQDIVVHPFACCFMNTVNVDTTIFTHCFSPIVLYIREVLIFFRCSLWLFLFYHGTQNVLVIAECPSCFFFTPYNDSGCISVNKYIVHTISSTGEDTTYWDTDYSISYDNILIVLQHY